MIAVLQNAVLTNPCTFVSLCFPAAVDLLVLERINSKFILPTQLSSKVVVIIHQALVSFENPDLMHMRALLLEILPLTLDTLFVQFHWQNGVNTGL